MSGLITVRIFEALHGASQTLLASLNFGLAAWTLLFGAVFLLLWRVSRSPNYHHSNGTIAVATPSSSTHARAKPSANGRRILVSISLDGRPQTEALYTALRRLAGFCDLVVEMIAATDDEENTAKEEISRKVGIPEHRVLCSSTANGRAYMVRQLHPAWHVDTDEDVLKYLIGLVPHLATTSPTAAKTAGESDSITVFASIDTFVDRLLTSAQK